MIIGVAGHIGSGKDLIGKIIQYLITKHMVDNEELSSFISIRRDVVWYNELNPCLHCGWQIKKFAYAVKQVASILTGIPVEDFEKEEVKNRLLGEEWIRYGYADGFYRDMDGNPIMNNKQCSKEKYEEEKRINWQTAYKYHYTGRTLMQQIGTEAIRNVIHEDAWVNALMNQYKKLHESYKPEIGHPRQIHIYEYPNWIVTDVRFPNEADAIRTRRGIIIKVNRNDYIFNKEGERIISTKEYQNVMVSDHSSETALDDYTFDYVIDNDGSIEDLITKVKSILLTEKLI